MITAAVLVFLTAAVVIYGATVVRDAVERGEIGGLVLPFLALLIGAWCWAILVAVFVL